MKQLCLSIMILLNFLIVGCIYKKANPSVPSYLQRQHVITMTKDKYPPKNPQKVSLYSSKEKPQTPYRVIGLATVSKYNVMGLRRDEAELHQTMKQLAASIGGDALININSNQYTIQGHVIAFQKILI